MGWKHQNTFQDERSLKLKTKNSFSLPPCPIMKNIVLITSNHCPACGIKMQLLAIAKECKECPVFDTLFIIIVILSFMIEGHHPHHHYQRYTILDQLHFPRYLDYGANLLASKFNNLKGNNGPTTINLTWLIRTQYIVKFNFPWYKIAHRVSKLPAWLR